MSETKKNRNNLITIAVIFAIVSIVLFYIFKGSLTIVVISVLTALVFKPIVDFLERNNVPRAMAVIFVFFTAGLIIFSLISFLLPKLINQFNELTNNLSEQNVRSSIGQFEQSLKSKFPAISAIDVSGKVTALINDFIFGIINNLTAIFYNVFSFIAVLIIVPFITFFLLKDNRRLMHGILDLVPNKYFEFFHNILFKVSVKLSRYVSGWILDATIVGFMSGIGLSILGINNAISIGFIAGIGHLIPYFGPIIGGIPAIIISIIQFGNLSMLPSLILMFVLIYSIDNGFIQPNIFSKSTDMHPVVIIILILIGSELLGVLGMLIIVPLTTVIITAIKEFYFGLKNYKIIQT